MLISLIITTYNRPDALEAVLRSLDDQTDKNFEVIVGDDGSGPETKKMLEDLIPHLSFPVCHAYQEDKGFRLSRVRNLAAKKAKGEYLIFLDGDCITRPSFIAVHRQLAQSGVVVAGNRVLLSKQFTDEILQKHIEVWRFKLLSLIKLKFSQKINRLLPLLVLPYFKKLRLWHNGWKQLRGCNFALFTKDFFTVNGCDSSFEGWGYEDSDLAVRLLRSGCKIKSGRYATAVFHLWHKENDRSQQKENLLRFQKRLHSDRVEAKIGIKELSKP